MPSSLRRMLKWRSAWLLFQAALLSGLSTSTLDRYTTLAAMTSFVSPCIRRGEICYGEFMILDGPLSHTNVLANCASPFVLDGLVKGKPV